MTTTFAGMPINGDIVYSSEPKDQRPDEEFTKLLQDVLDDPTIAFVGWRQYTPYFNDGDACTFHAYGLEVALRGLDLPGEDNDEYDEEAMEFPPYSGPLRDALGSRDYRNDHKYEGPDEARYDRLDALRHAIESGEFYVLLLKQFGDHARVKVVPNDGIYVEFCEHD